MPPRCRAGRAEADGIALRGAFNDSLEGGAMRPHASQGAAARPDGPAACAPDARLLRRRPAPRPVTAAARRGTPPTVHKAGPACAPTASSLRRHPANAEFGASTCSPPGRGAFPLPPGVTTPVRRAGSPPPRGCLRRFGAKGGGGRRRLVRWMADPRRSLRLASPNRPISVTPRPGRNAPSECFCDHLWSFGSIYHQPWHMLNC
jgi:hypothetical protein